MIEDIIPTSGLLGTSELPTQAISVVSPHMGLDTLINASRLEFLHSAENSLKQTFKVHEEKRYAAQQAKMIADSCLQEFGIKPFDWFNHLDKNIPGAQLVEFRNLRRRSKSLPKDYQYLEEYIDNQVLFQRYADQYRALVNKRLIENKLLTKSNLEPFDFVTSLSIYHNHIPESDYDRSRPLAELFKPLMQLTTTVITKLANWIVKKTQSALNRAISCKRQYGKLSFKLDLPSGESVNLHLYTGLALLVGSIEQNRKLNGLISILIKLTSLLEEKIQNYNYFAKKFIKNFDLDLSAFFPPPLERSPSIQPNAPAYL